MARRRNPRLQRTLATILFVVLFGIAVAIGWWGQRKRDEAPAPARPATGAGEATPGRAATARGGFQVDPALVRRFAAERDAGSGNEAVVTARRRFDAFCPYAPARRCAEGRLLADACAAGTAAACVQVGALMLTPPSLPQLAAGFFEAGCQLHDDAACDRWEQLLEWRESAIHATAVAEHEPTPPVATAATTACQAGQASACWFQIDADLQRGMPIDQAAAWRACNGGVADGCALLASLAPDAATAVATLGAGCQHGAPHQCQALARMYRGEGCCPTPTPDPDERTCVPCPAPNLAHAAVAEARARTLTTP